VSQIKSALSRVYGVASPDPTESALQEAQEGIDRARQLGSEVDLAPQNAYVRRLQHELVEQHEMTARSQGEEPNRHLVILGTAAS
jgi:predicted RNA-binding protein Jag